MLHIVDPTNGTGTDPNSTWVFEAVRWPTFG
jgi:hypothetical protein